MPRITEPTVAEHRSRQVRRLLDTAREMIHAEGAEALTLAALARRCGLSRPGLYEYFQSRDDLAAAMIEDEMPRWAEAIAERVDRSSGLTGNVEAFVRAQLEMMSDGSHIAFATLAAHVLEEPALARVRSEHVGLMRPLVDSLIRARVDQPELRAHLIQGLVNAATTHLRPGNRRHNAALTRTVIGQVLRGLSG